MSRQEDFIQAGIEYRFKHGTPNAIGGGALAEMVREMNRAKPFEFGAEYGYQYAQTHPNWISVEDELPKEKGAYLFHFDDGQTRVEDYFPELHLSKCVTHWMLIVPPRKEE